MKLLSYYKILNASRVNKAVTSAQCFSSYPAKVRIVEVGPRDGLQNEKNFVSADTKVVFIDKLYAAGLRSIEAGAFVSPKWIPQMATSTDVLQTLRNRRNEGMYSGAVFSALTPNMKGLDAALELGVQEVAVFGAASETFSQRNINCSIKESLQRFEIVCRAALQHSDIHYDPFSASSKTLRDGSIYEAESNAMRVRGYISCVAGCPYEGKRRTSRLDGISLFVAIIMFDINDWHWLVLNRKSVP